MRFDNECKSAFRNLAAKHKLHVVYYSMHGADQVVRFENDVAGFECVLDSLDHAVYINIYRLENGKVPEYPDLFAYDSRRGNFYDVFWLVKLRCPALKFNPAIKTKEDSVGKILSNYAVALEASAYDVLSGNFSIFSKLQELVDEHIRHLSAQND